MKNEGYFDHTIPPIQKCIDENCTGTMIRKTRPISFYSEEKEISIPNSEYWECDTCNAMVTPQQEIKRLLKTVQARLKDGSAQWHSFNEVFEDSISNEK